MNNPKEFFRWYRVVVEGAAVGWAWWVWGWQAAVMVFIMMAVSLAQAGWVKHRGDE